MVHGIGALCQTSDLNGNTIKLLDFGGIMKYNHTSSTKLVFLTDYGNKNIYGKRTSKILMRIEKRLNT